MDSPHTTAHVIITGRVQGVFYRAETKRASERIGVTGWVRNRPDGSVEAVLQGSEDGVNRTIDWCQKGSPHSRVEKIDISWEDTTEIFDSFEIRY
ncbi:MAG: acylphosphatase [Desulfobacteraceae bacterium]|nr:acylphosphatase [Desulfobacteraceae bacterium]